MLYWFPAQLAPKPVLVPPGASCSVLAEPAANGRLRSCVQLFYASWHPGDFCYNPARDEPEQV